MIDVDIMSILPQLEEIANAAGKEYDLNNRWRSSKSGWIRSICSSPPLR